MGRVCQTPLRFVARAAADHGGTMTDGTSVIDCDQHLYETRTMWREHIDPEHRDDALAIVDDDLGYPWLVWRERRLELCDVQHPRDTEALGRHRNRARDGLPPEYSYDRRCRTSSGNPQRACRSSTRWGSTRRCCSRTSACSGSARCRPHSPRSPPTWARGTAGAPPCAPRGAAGCTRSHT